jgi:endoglucanase
VNGTWPGGSNDQVWIKNTGTRAIDAWDVMWSFDGSQQITDSWSADVTQDGPAVSASNLSWNATIKPGDRSTSGFNTCGSTGDAPMLFRVDGQPCSVG